MKHLLRTIANYTLAGVVGMTNLAYAASQHIDLHQQRIGIWNVEEKVASALPGSRSSLFTLNLADNVLVDDDMPKLMSLVFSDSGESGLQVLNLSNNRLTIEGVKHLIPLLKMKNFRWLDISIGTLMVSDFTKIWELIEAEARRSSILEGGESSEALSNQWASKVVLLPKNYTISQFNLHESFVRAHREYYKIGE